MRRTLTNPTTVTTLAASAGMFLPLMSGAQESRPAVPFTVGEEPVGEHVGELGVAADQDVTTGPPGAQAAFVLLRRGGPQED